MHAAKPGRQPEFACVSVRLVAAHDSADTLITVCGPITTPLPPTPTPQSAPCWPLGPWPSVTTAVICSLSLYHSVYQQRLGGQMWGENLLEQRGQEATRWPSFMEDTQQGTYLSTCPKPKKDETPRVSLLLPMRLSLSMFLAPPDSLIIPVN